MYLQYVCIHVYHFEYDKCKCAKKKSKYDEESWCLSHTHTHSMEGKWAPDKRGGGVLVPFSWALQWLLCVFPHRREKIRIIDFTVFFWCQICCRLSSSNLSLCPSPSHHPSLSLSLFVLLINFITLIAPHCLWRKQLPSLPSPPLSLTLLPHHPTFFLLWQRAVISPEALLLLCLLSICLSLRGLCDEKS